MSKLVGELVGELVCEPGNPIDGGCVFGNCVVGIAFTGVNCVVGIAFTGVNSAFAPG